MNVRRAFLHQPPFRLIDLPVRPHPLLVMWMPTWLALGSLCLLAAHLVEAKADGRAAWLPSLRLIFKHSDEAIAGGCPRCCNVDASGLVRRPARCVHWSASLQPVTVDAHNGTVVFLCMA